MPVVTKRLSLLLAVLVISLLGLTTVVLVNQGSQELRTNASGAITSLSFTPASTDSTPVQKNIGEQVEFDVMLDPGQSLPSLVKLEITYDPAVFDVASASSFVVNTAAFPNVMEGPFVSNGSIKLAVSIGSDATKAIQAPTSVGTLKLITKTSTAQPVQISFGENSQVFSVAATDSNADVLASTSPAHVAVAGGPTATPTSPVVQPTEPVNTPTPTNIPSPTPTRTPTPTPTSTPTPTTAPTNNGLVGSYFTNRYLTGSPLVVRTDPAVNFIWSTAAPAVGIPADRFSVRWTGYVVPQFTQTYTFYTRSDDGARLWVNNKRLVNNWSNHSTTENKGTISLTAGVRYPIVMEYYENLGNATAQLFWSSASTPKQVVPPTRLFPQ